MSCKGSTAPFLEKEEEEEEGEREVGRRGERGLVKGFRRNVLKKMVLDKQVFDCGSHCYRCINCGGGGGGRGGRGPKNVFYK